MWNVLCYSLLKLHNFFYQHKPSNDTMHFIAVLNVSSCNKYFVFTFLTTVCEFSLFPTSSNYLSSAFLTGVFSMLVSSNKQSASQNSFCHEQIRESQSPRVVFHVFVISGARFLQVRLQFQAHKVLQH